MPYRPPVSVGIWTTATLLNGWTNLGLGTPPAGYLVDSLGVVWLRGALDGSNATDNTMFTLPAGYRPTNSLIFGVATGGVSFALTPGRVDIGLNGSVVKIEGGIRMCLSATLLLRWVHDEINTRIGSFSDFYRYICVGDYCLV